MLREAPIWPRLQSSFVTSEFSPVAAGACGAPAPSPGSAAAPAPHPRLPQCRPWHRRESPCSARCSPARRRMLFQNLVRPKEAGGLAFDATSCSGFVSPPSCSGGFALLQDCFPPGICIEGEISTVTPPRVVNSQLSGCDGLARWDLPVFFSGFAEVSCSRCTRGPQLLEATFVFVPRLYRC